MDNQPDIQVAGDLECIFFFVGERVAAVVRGTVNRGTNAGGQHALFDSVVRTPLREDCSVAQALGCSLRLGLHAGARAGYAAACAPRSARAARRII
eukprot:COSAG02_NODE_1113_length_14503_cov_87.812205_5_plen_96_part_00